jgi:hypothetical protein
MHIIPKPLQLYDQESSYFTVRETTRVVIQGASKKIEPIAYKCLEMIRDRVAQQNIQYIDCSDEDDAIILHLMQDEKDIPFTNPDCQSYEITVTPRHVIISETH